MNLIKQHIDESFNRVIYPSITVSQFINDFYGEVSEPLRNILRFIALSLNTIKSDELKSIHFHISVSLSDEEKVSLINFLAWIEHNNFYALEQQLKADTPEEAKIKIQLIANKAKSDLFLPVQAKNKRAINKLKLEKRLYVRLNKFHKRFLNASFRTKTLFNIPTKLLVELRKTKWHQLYYGELSSSILNYVVLNDRDSLTSIEQKDEEFLDLIKSVILFDCQSKTIFKGYNIKEMTSSWEIDLKRFLIVTFSDTQASLKRQLTNIKDTQENFGLGVDDTVFIPHWHAALNGFNTPQVLINISFSGYNIPNLFWAEVVALCKEQDLYELISTRLKNLYAVTYSRELREWLLQEIFENLSSSIISGETSEGINGLTEESKKELKNSLDLALESLCEVPVDTLNSFRDKYDAILIDSLIEKTPLYKEHLTSMFGNDIIITSWEKVSDLECENCLILSFRDSGRGIFSFFPSLLEGLNPAIIFQAIFPSFLFKTSMDWAWYNHLNSLRKSLAHKVYNEFFDMVHLDSKLKEIKPSKPLDISFAVESEYSSNLDRKYLSVKINEKRKRLCTESDLVIYNEAHNDLFRLCSINELCTLSNDGGLNVALLDEILDNINLYDGIAQDASYIKAINAIKKDYSIEESDAGRLWKMLLKIKSNEVGEAKLYDELKAFMMHDNLKLVSKNHFINVWLDPKSESIAPISKKIFLKVCSYLGLPKVYFILIQRLKNVHKSNTRSNNIKMISLLNDLFEDGCFDKNSDYHSILNKTSDRYIKSHSLDELGIENEYVVESLTAFIEMIQVEIKLNKLEWIRPA